MIEYYLHDMQTAFWEVWGAGEGAPGCQKSKNGCCGSLLVAEPTPNGSGRPFQAKTRYSGHTWSRLSRGGPNTTKQMVLPTTWEAEHTESKNRVSSNCETLSNASKERGGAHTVLIDELQLRSTMP